MEADKLYIRLAPTNKTEQEQIFRLGSLCDNNIKRALMENLSEAL